jgi:hypothetical protein
MSSPISNNDLRISRVQRTLRWFEEDIPLLNLRVKELSPERQESAKRFAAAVIDQTRAELKRLLQNADLQNEMHHCELSDAVEAPCEPAD